jgi:non-ribosomal peptide synthetase component E (peptide arylation enzyme)
VESLIFRHPAVKEVAVGYPDERLGERACALVTVDLTVHLDLAALTAFLLKQGLSKRYVPERVIDIAEMPKP